MQIRHSSVLANDIRQQPLKVIRDDVFRRERVSVPFALMILGLMFGCASDTSFDRHNLSRLWLSADEQRLFFDATVSNAYPENDPEAESTRKAWIQEWLELRSFCDSGYTIAGRRLIRPEEYNPMRHHLRYELTCN